mmetsp:Transcript_4848/g.7924  ORF Transcript_4848/g.7924 Transcript_4848/m.7924 type:complete len:723 (+) Transcript_4848:75-2243(+)|eukprot:CAMPEP_0174964832 /NCGR_PEP_ID=MMETSP0004_2-20121128/6102_1 /TAXON_ID=420556 /ORGANISM="Ochromonas sp., Strain CCMP1393" /LENGTH=722 /DNA_ID=CAMNT_0016213607 /DNA_START=74 /DNA_END=2242 /DNA_ORIENTATION=-
MSGEGPSFEKVSTSDIGGDVELGSVYPSLSSSKEIPSNSGRSLRFNEAGIKEATIVWKNLDKHVDLEGGKTKQILFNIGGTAKPGEMIALMGPSGSGKTTLLNVLGGRALSNLKGEVQINSVKYKKSMRRTIAYVLQEDIFYTNLTVKQQLYFTSHLRLPDALSKEEKASAVEHVIKTLRIERCQDTKIMLISGGEKKRTNIGTELLTNPSILLLDEPTSGLDSTAANSLVLTLRKLAEDRMTILTSIHQPSSKVFYAFDKLILMADGCMVYYGAPDKCLSYLNSGARGLTYAPPADYNPADFLMDLVTNTTTESGESDTIGADLTGTSAAEGNTTTTATTTTTAAVGADGLTNENGEPPCASSSSTCTSTSTSKSIRTILIEAWDNTPIEEDIRATSIRLDRHPSTTGINSPGNKSVTATDKDSDSDAGEDVENVKYLASYNTQFKVLLERAMINSQASIMTTIGMVQTIGIAIITGLVWWQVEYTEERVDDKSGYIFFFMTYWFFMTLFGGMMQFLPERDIILKERASGSYRLSAYFLSKILSELPIRLFMPFIFLCISYPMAAMNPDPGAFFAIVGTQLLAALAGESAGLFIGTLTMDFEKALTIATLGSLILMLTGGFFVQGLPIFVSWIRYLSPFKYSYDACVQLEFDRAIPCDDGDVLDGCLGNPNGEVNGQAAVSYLGATLSVGLNEALLGLFILVFRILAYLALRFMPHNNGRT